MNHAMKTNGLPLAVYSETVEAASPEQLAEGFEQLGLTVHRIVDPLPHDRLNIGDQSGLSPSWVIGHLALLFRSVLESLGEPATEELPPGFTGDFGPAHGQSLNPASVKAFVWDALRQDRGAIKACMTISVLSPA